MTTIQSASAKGPRPYVRPLVEYLKDLRYLLLVAAGLTALVFALAYAVTPAHAEYNATTGGTNVVGGTLHASGQGNAGALMRAIENQYPRTQFFELRTDGLYGVLATLGGWFHSWGFYEHPNTTTQYGRYNSTRGAASTGDTRGFGHWSW